MVFDENLTTDIECYDLKKCEKHTIKRCILINSFTYKKIEFFTLSKVLNYYICLPTDNLPLVLWSYPKDGKTNFNQVVSEFRKNFDKENITSEMVDLFVNNPKKYKKKYLARQK